MYIYIYIYVYIYIKYLKPKLRPAQIDVNNAYKVAEHSYDSFLNCSHLRGKVVPMKPKFGKRKIRQNELGLS